LKYKTCQKGRPFLTDLPKIFEVFKFILYIFLSKKGGPFDKERRKNK